MGFFKSLKGDHPKTIGSSEDSSYAPPQGHPPSHRQQSRPTQSTSTSEGYAPPQGPPPGRQEFAPPPGPSSFAKPLEDPPPYHDWTVIPDNSLLPPPPSFGHITSPSSNATSSDAERAGVWCLRYPLMNPHQPSQQQYGSVQNGDIRIVKPREYTGDLFMVGTGAWKASSRAGSNDSCLLTSFPLYFACADSPSLTEVPKTIYFEIRVGLLGRGRRNEECSIALGYTGLPYPTWRMPGWQRGSLAVHGDDGRKYINDNCGGKDFTSPFKEGETIGLGMTFSLPDSPPKYGPSRAIGSGLEVEIFLTRNGQSVDKWNLHEQLDASTDLDIDGLDGQYDLYGAIGVFGGAEFDIFFNSKDWLWQPR